MTLTIGIEGRVTALQQYIRDSWAIESRKILRLSFAARTTPLGRQPEQFRGLYA
jgi:hypothetical protein